MHHRRLTRPTVLLVAVLGLTATSCADDSSGAAQVTSTTSPASFCDAASAFATAQLGGAAEWQSGPGAAVMEAIRSSVGAVDAAVQQECGHFINDPG